MARWRLQFGLGCILVFCIPCQIAAPEQPIQLTKGPRVLTQPIDVPEGQVWVYGFGVPFQAGPTTAGVFCNIRAQGTPFGDFEMGSDLILFDEVSAIDARNAVPVSRFDKEPDPRTGKSIILAKYSVVGGFVPYGAMTADGRPHPHAGTGFAIVEAVGYPADPTEPELPDSERRQFRELHQFTFDGEDFTTTDLQRIDHWRIGGGWEVIQAGLSMALPEGDDLLLPMVVMKEEAPRERLAFDIYVSGVGRFSRKTGKWALESFVPIGEPTERWWEPSMVYDRDGSLLWTARGGYEKSRGDLVLWRSRDIGQSWERRFHLKHYGAGAPVVLNRTADGKPYLATNEKTHDRQILCIYPINAARDGLENPVVVRHGPEEFGPAPSDAWKVDHPLGAVVRLADGKWHSLLVYRVLDQAENRGADASRHTGMYVEEVFSEGAPQPAWRF